MRGVTGNEKYITYARATLTSTQASLSEAQKELEALRLENASLSHCLTDYSTASHRVVLEAFENDLH